MSEEEIIKMLNNFPQIEVVKYILEIQEENKSFGKTINESSELLIKKDNRIEKLQQENKSLKEKIDIAETNYDIIYGYFTQVNELLGTELCEEVLDKILKLKRENKELKNKQNKFEKDCKEMIEIQGQDGNYNYDSYMLGLYNGMEYIISLYENREPIYKNGKDIKFLHENNILTEFEKWLEERYRQQTETLNKMEEDNIEKRYVKSRRYLVEECLDKLQELKEVQNETNNNI